MPYTTPQNTQAAGPATLAPIHPGVILAEDYMKPYGLTQSRLAELLHVPQNRISRIVHGQIAITPDSALRLASLFGGTAGFWVNLQTRFDLETAKDAMDAKELREIAKHHGELLAVA